MANVWLKIKRVILVVVGLAFVLLSLGGLVGSLFYGAPTESVGTTIVCVLLLLIAGGLSGYMVWLGIRGSDEDVREVSLMP